MKINQRKVGAFSSFARKWFIFLTFRIDGRNRYECINQNGPLNFPVGIRSFETVRFVEPTEPDAVSVLIRLSD